LAEALDAATRKTVRIRDIPMVLVAPRRVFARAEDVPAYGWPLLILLTAVTLLSYGLMQTGLIDREVDGGVAQRIAQLESEQHDVVERSELREMYQEEYKLGEFMKLLTRIKIMAIGPAKVLATVLMVAAVLYGVVALTGRKPEWHTLLTICVFAGYVELLRQLMLLILMVQHETLDVDTSLALLLRHMPDNKDMEPMTAAAATSLLSALDPFRIWYWLIAIAGLSATTQLPGWRAWLTCLLCWLVGAGARCGLAVATVQSVGGAANGG
jgi:hypothetical protein